MHIALTGKGGTVGQTQLYHFALINSFTHISLLIIVVWDFNEYLILHMTSLAMDLVDFVTQLTKKEQRMSGYFGFLGEAEMQDLMKDIPHIRGQYTAYDLESMI